MNKENIVNHNVFIDIDALFDTRLPILYALSSKTAIDYIKTDKYFTRIKDSFKNIPANVFKGFYKYRDKRVLLVAKPTEMFNLLTEYLETTTANMVSLGDNRAIKIYLNIYPYNLLKTETDVIVNLIKNLNGNVDVEVVSFSNFELKPKWIEKNTGVIIKYDSLNWIDTHIAYGELPKNPLLDVLMMGPQLILGDVKSKDITNELFNSMLESINTLIGYNFIRTSYYCMIKDEKK